MTVIKEEYMASQGISRELTQLHLMPWKPHELQGCCNYTGFNKSHLDTISWMRCRHEKRELGMTQGHIDSRKIVLKKIRKYPKHLKDLENSSPLSRNI